MTEVMSVLARIGEPAEVHEALGLIEDLGMARIGNGGALLRAAATFACDTGLSGYDATYLALASLTGARWLTADARVAKKVRKASLVGCSAPDGANARPSETAPPATPRH